MNGSMIRLLQIASDPVVIESLGVLDLVILAVAVLAPHWLNPIAFVVSLLVTAPLGVAFGRRFWVLK